MQGGANRAENRKRARSAGFTLIEIVIAVGLMGGVLFVLLDMHYRALQLYQDARHRVMIRNFLSQAVGRAETEILAGNLAGEGDFGKRYEDYSYSYEAQQLGEAGVLLYEVLVTVQDPDEETYEAMLMVYDPRSGAGGPVNATGGAAGNAGTGQGAGISNLLSGSSATAGSSAGN